MNNRQKLLQAATLILEVSKQLDLSSEECKSCGLTVYNNFGHRTINEALEGAAAKLQRIAEGDTIKDLDSGR